MDEKLMTLPDIREVAEKQAELVRSMFGEGDKKRDSTIIEPDGICEIRDIQYDSRNLLDVYFPENSEKLLPIIVNIHGGAYVYGSKEVYRYYGMFMAKQGFVFINPNYSLAPKFKFPTQLEEINRVFQWIDRTDLRFHMDRNNMFIVGDSAGAQMASQIGTIYSNKQYEKLFSFEFPRRLKIRAIALNCGIYDLLKMSKEPRNKMDAFLDYYVLSEIYLGEEGRKKEPLIDVIGNIGKGYPPTYIMSSYYDFLKEHAEPFYEILRKKGIKSVLKIYGREGDDYMGHVFHCNLNLEEARRCNIEECNFFKNYIV